MMKSNQLATTLNQKKQELQNWCQTLECISQEGKESKEDIEAIKTLLISFSPEDIALILKDEMITLPNSVLEKLLIDTLTDPKILKDIAISAVKSSEYQGNGEPVLGVVRTYNKQEQRAQMCINKITHPRALLELLGKVLSQATANKNVSGIAAELTEKIIQSSLIQNPDIDVADDAIKLMMPVVRKIPVWSKSSDAHLTAYLRSLNNLFAQASFITPTSLCHYFIAIHTLKVDMLNIHKGTPLSNKVQEIIEVCEAILKSRYNYSIRALNQEELMALVTSLLTVTSNQQDTSGNRRIRELLVRITDHNAVFKALMEKLKTHECHGVNEEFLVNYLNTFTPVQVLSEIAPLCMHVKQGNGKAHSTVLSCLNAQFELLPDNYVQSRISNISMEDEEEVTRIVHVLESMNHKLYPQSMLSLAEYFYRKSTLQKEEEDTRQALENAGEMIFKLDCSSDFAVNLKDSIVANYGNHFFPEQNFMQAEAVLDFIGIDNIAKLTFDRVQDAIKMKQKYEQANIVKDKDAAKAMYNASLAQKEVPVTETEAPVRIITGKKTPPPPPPLPPAVILSKPAQAVAAINTPQPLIGGLDEVCASIVKIRRGMLSGDKNSLEEVSIINQIALTVQFSDTDIQTIIGRFEALENYCRDGKGLKLKMEGVLDTITPCKQIFIDKLKVKSDVTTCRNIAGFSSSKA